MPPLEKTDADAPPGGVRVHASFPEPERRGRLATLLSFLLHALIILLAIRLTAAVALPEHSPLGDAVELALGGGGGGGGQGGVAAVHTTPPPPPVKTPPPVVPPPPPPPVPTVIPPPPPTQVTPPPPPAAADPSPAGAVAAAGTGSGTGGGNGTGTGTGTGSGQGPGTGSGKGGGEGGGNGGFPPEPKQMIVPAAQCVPSDLRGKSVEVTFHVAADGRRDRRSPSRRRSMTARTPRSLTKSCATIASSLPGMPSGKAVPGVTTDAGHLLIRAQ